MLMQEGSALKPHDPDFKQDLSLSQSLHQYEVMDAMLRSSLLAVIEKSGTEESGEDEAEEEEEKEAGKVENKKDGDR